MNGHRLLLDQMLDADVASTLLAAGYGVVRVSELGMARSDDDSILMIVSKGRVRWIKTGEL
ncbi:MAG: hypothetical protein A3K19_16330 [Lentisphaerae bacterium RIFOXYB12_FULL_65_16]|nr:MAG: hypothetical protein A3K18_32760 [Lentisphaerae bacterium RIFOXYA12_64_32]OGV89011.1 MAG: hypothetical protein A3K19_16330 [Lentisphaerae bacterium RIFOXYB12_FULL_65_16]